MKLHLKSVCSAVLAGFLLLNAVSCTIVAENEENA